MATKCNPDVRNNSWQTAAMYAAFFQWHDLLGQFKAKGADMNAIDGGLNNVVTLSLGEINNH
ncbi:hypothetical protein [Serratia ureilytica]|uniref:hypothetical protein n=1 Tax=Serratia ureilytica TaxID=300181 RepID=UPI00384AFEF7